MSNAKTGERVLHAPPHQSLNATTTTVFKLPTLTTVVNSHVPWLEFAMNQQLLFRGEHMLGDYAESIAWGIDTSPLQDLIAVCVSQQATAVPTYTNPADEESQVVILPPEDRRTEQFTFATTLDLDSTEGNACLMNAVWN
jgi:hypothetical protein